MTEFKNIEVVCKNDSCKFGAIAKILLVEDPELQKKINARAADKLRYELDKAHKQGEHSN